MLVLLTWALRSAYTRKYAMTSADMQALWAAVTHRAWADYLEDARDAKPAERPEAWAEAGLFLFSQSGSWATSREVVCLAAGLDPDALRAKAMALAECHWFPLVANG